MLEWVKVHGDLTIGHRRYYAGVETEVLCDSPADTLRAFLEVTDVETIAACLSANAWKYGACSKALPAEVYAKHFIRTVRNVLADGKPRRALFEVDTRFVVA